MKTIFGIILLPVSIALTIVLAKTLRYWETFNSSQFLFLAGFVSYFVIHIILYKPIFAYVMSHELTHAFWAWILGHEVKSLYVSKKGGSTTLSNANAFIALVPYFFPLYTILVLIIIAIAKNKLIPYLMFTLGATLAFHIALTLNAIRTKQSDFKESGRVFSLSVIYFANLVIIILLLSFVSPSVVKLQHMIKNTILLIKQTISGFLSK